MKTRTLLAVSTLVLHALIIPLPVHASTPSTSVKPTAVMEKGGTKTATAPADEAMMPAKVEYALPYPGILPDHPLYFLKDLRDQIFERLIADPVRKAEFYILQADKRMNMAVFLEAKGNVSLAVESLAKSNKFMEKGLSTAITLKEQGKEVPAYITEKFTNALMKHEEVVAQLVTKAAEGSRENFVNAQNQLKDLQALLIKLKR